MCFEFATPTDIFFGVQALQKALPRIRNCGKHAFLVHGKDASRSQPIVDALHHAGVGVTHFHVIGEPDLAQIEKAREKALTARCDYVIGMGGGSVLDTAKAVAAMLTNREPLLRYLEGNGAPLSLVHVPATLIAIPTTAGTGSEVTRNAVIAVPEKRVKVSLRSPLMYPDLAVVDPSLMLSLPLQPTLYSGWDAITQLIESYLTLKANPITDAMCVDGLRRALSALPKLMDDLECLPARSEMALAALYSGIALGNAGLGAVHGIAGPLGGFYNMHSPHGAICARLLPAVFASHVSHAASVPGLFERLQVLASLMLDSPEASPAAAGEWLLQRIDAAEIPRLAFWGLNEADFSEIAQRSLNASSMQGNPVRLTESQIVTLLQLSH
ncbi:MAG: iron-containing alcohol dehydrogenase [Opitutales bacterium]|nr:iron-containing alcohol dehydrogenase [Opitutales bacterium]